MKREVHFNVSAYTARLLGRENVSTLDGAILELVKNTYDADATQCILYYDMNEKVLYIMDNGYGMDEETIEEHWMNIGNSSKYANYITKNGRIQTGAKGIGRFALDRVGNNCTMYTKQAKDNEVIEWNMDWSCFERSKKLTDVVATIERIDTGEIYSKLKIKNKDIIDMLKKDFSTTGTIFKISNLSDLWTSDMIKSIRDNLSSLVPSYMENEFLIYLFENNQTKEDAQIVFQDIDKHDYRIQFDIEEDQTLQIRIHRNEFDLGKEIDDIIKQAEFTKEDKEYFLGKEIIINGTIEELINKKVDTLGKVTGTLYYNKIMTSKDDAKKYYYKDMTGRTNYTDMFGGIKIYRDNFRVRPYGEKGTSNYDWLSLGSRNSGSAAISHKTNRWRVAADQILGIINISRVNVNLPDQANRGGIIETKEFKALKEIVIAIIDQFELDRQYVGRKLAKKHEKKDSIGQAEEEIRNKAKAINSGKKTGNESDESVKADVAQKVIDDKEEQIKNLEDENRMLRNLATTGIIANQYIHETRQSVDDIALNITTAEDVLENEKNIEETLELLEEAEHYVEILNSWFLVTLSSIRRDKRKMKYTNIKLLIDNQIKMWNDVLENQDIHIIPKIDEELKEIRCFAYEIESIISNLIANSVEALKRKTEKNIKIAIKNMAEGIVIKYEDNGEGLAEGYKKNPEKILEAFETNRRDSSGEKIGTGMGMWIIRNIVSDYGGTINLEGNKNRESGFIAEVSLNTLIREE